MRERRHVRLGMAVLIWLTMIGTAQAAPSIAEYTSGITSGQNPTSITRGPDGNLWFTESGGPGALGRITPSGAVTEFTAGLSNGDQPTGITAGPDGNLWFTEKGNPGQIGRITPAGVITEFTSGLTNDSQPTGIVSGPDGALWFTERANPAIGRITTAGVITEFTNNLTNNSSPTGIALGPDGNLWFTEQANPGRIGRITPAGVITEFATPSVNSQPVGITAGPDGNLWFTEQANPGRIGRITTAGVITEFTSGLTTNEQPLGITAEPDGNVWFTKQANPGRIGRITLPPGLTIVSPTAVDYESATLKGSTTPRSQATTYHFEYGPTASYGTLTATTSAGSGSTPQAVSAPISGLTPQSTYHFRAVATNASGTTIGADQTLTTDVAPTLPPPPSPLVQPPPLEPVAPPVLGKSVTVDVVSGTVLVRRAGSSAFVDLDGTGASLPVGSSIDASHGVLRLSAALPGGRSQMGTFWDGLFRVGQNRRTGVTNLVVPRPRACAPRTEAGTSQSFARRPRPPANRLWARDSHGRFSTHGANSAATVRGTKWLTEERCDGTLTRVVGGRVLVRDLRTHRSVLVSAGHAYLARAHPLR